MAANAKVGNYGKVTRTSRDQYSKRPHTIELGSWPPDLCPKTSQPGYKRFEPYGYFWRKGRAHLRPPNSHNFADSADCTHNNRSKR